MNPMQNRRFHLQLVIGWLLAGSTLALLMPVSPSNTTLGWSGVYWLLCAPALMLASFAWRSLQAVAAQAAPSRRCSMRRKNSAMMSR